MQGQDPLDEIQWTGLISKREWDRLHQIMVDQTDTEILDELTRQAQNVAATAHLKENNP